jgi:hypothetical protein
VDASGKHDRLNSNESANRAMALVAQLRTALDRVVGERENRSRPREITHARGFTTAF